MQNYIGFCALIFAKLSLILLIIYLWILGFSKYAVISYAKNDFHFFLSYTFTYFFKIYFIYLFLAALGLRCCAWAFSSCGEQGLLFLAAHGLLILGLLLLWSTVSRHAGSVAVARGL